MTPEEQRIAIAEACGWKWYRRPATGVWAAKPMRTLYHPQIAPEYVATLQPADMTERECNPVFIWREGLIPDYLNDLNAMHEAEKTLDGMAAWRFTQVLWTVIQPDKFANYELERVVMANASQRAEAFLRTIGKWKEDLL
jgi:hypothetical protein